MAFNRKTRLAAALDCVALVFALLLIAAPGRAQISGPSPSGVSVPAVGIYCMNSSGSAVVCSFGSGGGGGGAVTESGTWNMGLTYNGSVVSPTNLLGVSDQAMDALISGGKLPVSDAALEAIISGGALKTADTVADTALGTPADAAYTGSNTASLVALEKALYTAWSSTGLKVTQTGTWTEGLNAGTANIGSIDILGTGGAAFDVVTTGGTSATHAIVTGCRYVSTPLALVSTQSAAVACNTVGGFAVDPEVQKATYFVSGTQTLASAPTDVFELCGVASKKLRIRQWTIQGIATTAGGNLVSIIKRSAADTATSPTSLSSFAADSTYAASAALAYSFPANPTALGATVGTLKAEYVAFPLIANSVPPVTIPFGAPNGDTSLVLNSATECASASLNGATIAAGQVLTTNIEYTLE